MFGESANRGPPPSFSVVNCLILPLELDNQIGPIGFLKESPVPWDAIKYVSSGLTLVAFIAAAILTGYRRSLLSRERLINLTPAGQRAQLVKSTLKEYFDVNTENLTEEHAYDLALQQIHARSRRYLINALVVSTILLCSIIAAIASLLLPKSVIPAPAQIQPTITSPGPNQTYPQKYRIVFSASAFDPQFGDVDDQHFSWVLDGGNVFATGKSVTFGDLPLGHHTITLKAINRNGQLGAASVDITIVPQGTHLTPVGTFVACPPPARADSVSGWDKWAVISCVSDRPDESGSGIRVYGVSDSHKIVELPLLPMPRPEKAAYKGGILFVPGGDVVRLYDASDPVHLRPAETPSLPPSAIIISGNILVARSYDATTKLYDIGNPSHPKEIATYINDFGGLGVQAGPWAGIYGTTLLLGDRWQGLHLIDFSKAPATSLTATLPGDIDHNYASNVEVVNDIAYVGCRFRSLKSIYVRDPAHPQIVGSLDGIDAPSIKYQDGKIYVASYSEGLQIIDVRNPATPKYDSAIYDYKYVSDVTVQGNLVFLAAEHDLVVLQQN
jgi:hypothetical protein